MNNPAADIFEEIRWMSELGMQFLDLTLEPPCSGSWQLDPPAVREALRRHGMKVVGHTAFYLPMASALEEVRRGAIQEMLRCIEVFAGVGARSMNIHPDRYTPFHDRAFFVRRNIESLRELVPAAAARGITLMVENLPGEFNSAAQLGELLDPLPEVGLHLDFGHANLMVPQNTSEEILAAYGRRLRHVHLHDNKGGTEDMHLPLGVGNLDVRAVVRALKRCGYDSTITLEVFTPDKHYLTYSAEVLRKLWDSV